MNNKALTLSLVMAAIAVGFVQTYVSSVQDEAKRKYGTAVLVIVAKRDIKEMETVIENMLELKEIPKTFLEPAAISLEKTDDNLTTKTLRELAGMIAVVPIKKGEQVTYNKLIEPGMKTGLAPQVSPGKRAMAIPVGEVSGVSKLLKPGDRVDLITIMDFGNGKELKLAKTVLQDVVVLSIGRYVTNNIARSVEADPLGGKDRIRALAEDFSYSSVTLEVEPGQAQVLALLLNSAEGSMYLTLRNNDDTERVNSPSTTLGDLLGADASRVLKSAGAPKR